MNDSQFPRRRETFFALTSVVFALLLSGCAGPNAAPENNSNADRERNVQEEFDANKLPKDIRSLVEAAFPVEKKFNKMVIEYNVVETKNGTDRSLTSTMTEYGRAHGLVISHNEFAGNGIPYRINDGISLFGMFTLDTRSTYPLRNSNQRKPADGNVKKIEFITPSPAAVAAGSSFVVRYKTGKRGENAVLAGYEAKFTFGPERPASQINPALEGSAMDCEMEQSKEDGTLLFKHKYVYLANYGTSLVAQSDSSQVEVTYFVKSVRFE